MYKIYKDDDFLTEIEYLEDWFFDEVNDEEVENWIDEIYPDFEMPILGKVSLSRVVKEVDPICFDMCVQDYIDFVCSDWKYEIELYGSTTFYRYNAEYEIKDGDVEDDEDK